MKIRTRGVLTLLTSLVLIAGVYIVWSAPYASKGTPDSEPVARGMRRDLRERIDEYHATVNDVLSRANDVTATINSHDLKLVSSAGRYAVRTLADDETLCNLSPKLRGELNFLLGLSSLVYRQVNEARDAFAEASHEFDQSRKAFTDSQVLLSHARVLNALCCVNAEMGFFEEAETGAKVALDVASQLRNFDLFADAALFEQANTLRSLAILAALKGQPALQYAGDSLRAAEGMTLWVRVEEGWMSFETPDFILDCHLLLALLHSLNGDVAAAQTELQASIKCMEEMQAVLDQETRFEERIGLTLRLRRLRIYLRQQLETLNERAEKSSAQQPDGGQYLWMPMRHQPARSLHIGMLYTGKMQAEFEKQGSIALLWRDWEWGQSPVLTIARHVSSRMLTRVFVNDETSLPDVEAALKTGGANMTNVRIRVLPTDSIWIRDFGPLVSVTPGNQQVFVDAVYGPKGLGKYRCDDEVVPERMARIWDMPIVRTPLFIQGGELLVNGAGLCVVSQSLIERNTVREITPEFVIENLKRITGATEVVVLESLIDEPTGHVDWFATFTSATTILVGSYSDPSDPNTALLDRNAALLDGFMTSQGPLKVVRIPMPPRQQDWFGGSYTNVAYANGMLMLPTWNGASSDNLQAAVDAYREALPGWEIVTIPGDALGRQQGAIHCMTLGLPVLNSLFD